MFVQVAITRDFASGANVKTQKRGAGRKGMTRRLSVIISPARVCVFFFFFHRMNEEIFFCSGVSFSISHFDSFWAR